MILTIAVILVSYLGESVALESLQQYNVDGSSVTTSGFSSGGAMATQFHFINSDILSGVGIFAGSPYLCGGDFLKCLVTPDLINVTELTIQASSLAQQNQIDDIANLVDSKVFIYHGQNDSSNGPANGRKIAEMYSNFRANISTVFNISAQHGMPTSHYGAPCGSVATDTQYITNCNYDGAFQMLNYLYNGSLNRPASYGWEDLPGNFIEFSQDEFFQSSPTGLDLIGFAYVPYGCVRGSKQCKLHMVFHGCAMGREILGDIFAKKAGYLEVAELNNIITVFPQILPNVNLGNPGGCWDTWGYTNDKYATRNGPQNEALVAILNRIIYG